MTSETPSSPPPTQYAPRPRRKLAIVAAVIVVLVVVFAVISFAFLRSEAHLQVNVYSTHLLTSIGYNLAIDGKIVESGTLGVGEYLNYTTTYHWWLSDNATIEISASSSGGLLGDLTDTETLEVRDGGTYTVNLFV